MYAIFAMRKMELTSRINQIQCRLMELSQKLTDIALFGANIEDGIISPEEFVSSPSSVFDAQLLFGVMTLKPAKSIAEKRTESCLAYDAMLRKNGLKSVLPINPNSLYAQNFQQVLSQMSKGIQKRIAAEETKIQMEKTRLETQLKAAEAELQQCDNAEQKGIERSTPKYA